MTFGKSSEGVAAGYLQDRGYRILHRNYRTPQGEVDLIADDRGTLVFVEVKARRSGRFGSPADAVDDRKQGRIATAARHYLLRHRLTDRPCRFDVVLLIQRPHAHPEIQLIQHAFDAREF